jgi:hypothetical protein
VRARRNSAFASIVSTFVVPSAIFKSPQNRLASWAGGRLPHWRGGRGDTGGCCCAVRVAK